MTHLIGYSKNLDSQNKAIVIKSTEDRLIWGYYTENGNRISDSQFDVKHISSNENWVEVAENYLRLNFKCYQIKILD